MAGYHTACVGNLSSWRRGVGLRLRLRLLVTLEQSSSHPVAGGDCPPVFHRRRRAGG